MIRIVSYIMQSLELAQELETTARYALWKWNLGSYQQYYSAYPLLVESIMDPVQHNSDRVWGILDFVFGSSPFLSSESKTLHIRQSLLATIPKLHLRLGINPAHGAPSGSICRTSTSGLDDQSGVSVADPLVYEQRRSSGHNLLDIDWVSLLSSCALLE